jgi:Ca-activated chloride channel family protein
MSERKSPSRARWPWGLAIVASLPMLMGVDLLQSRNGAVEDGNARMKAGKAEEALGQYDKALTKLPSEPGVHFNRGAALYGLSRFEEAAQSFLRATESKNPELKASAFYNLGNSFFQAKKYGEAVEAFKKSLTYNPADARAKWNLELALKMKRDEDKKKDENKDDKNKDNKKDDKNKDNKKSDKPDDKKNDKQDDKKQDEQGKGDKPDDKKDEQAKDDKPEDKKDDKKEDKPEDKPNPPEAKQDEKKDQKQPQPSSQDKDKQDKKNEAAALREIDGILDSLERSPKKLEQERARLRAVRRQPPAKDW